MADGKPRDPGDHEYTGTGSSRSADDGRIRQAGWSGHDVDPAIITGARSTAHPAQPDDLDVNRSGSGGTGGPVEADDVEGSTGESMSELLGGEEEPA